MLVEGGPGVGVWGCLCVGGGGGGDTKASFANVSVKEMFDLSVGFWE